MIATLLVEDQHLLREGIKLILESDPEISVAAEAQTASEALSILRKQSFDAIVMDLSLPDQDGLECIAQLRASACQIPILVVTMHKSPQVVRQAQSLGANGYVLKSASPQELRQALRTVAQGQSYLQEVLKVGEPPPSLPQLSRNERKLLNLFERLGDESELPESMGLSSATIGSLTRSLLRKLSTSSLEEAVARATRLGFILKEPHS